MPQDRRGKLGAEPFRVRTTRDKAFVYFRGRLVVTLTGAVVDALRAAQAQGDTQQLQLLLARHTGNFKRGNER